MMEIIETSYDEYVSRRQDKLVGLVKDLRASEASRSAFGVDPDGVAGRFGLALTMPEREKLADFLMAGFEDEIGTDDDWNQSYLGDSPTNQNCLDCGGGNSPTNQNCIDCGGTPNLNCTQGD